MRKADVFMHEAHAGVLEEMSPQTGWRFTYDGQYDGPPISLTMPVRPEPYTYDAFPPFFEGLLPEGYNLEALLRALKIDRNDLFKQLVVVGEDLVGAVTVREKKRRSTSKTSHSCSACPGKPSMTFPWKKWPRLSKSTALSRQLKKSSCSS